MTDEEKQAAYDAILGPVEHRLDADESWKLAYVGKLEKAKAELKELQHEKNLLEFKAELDND